MSARKKNESLRRRKLTLESLEDRRVFAGLQELIATNFTVAPREITAVGDKVFFVAGNSANGTELWTSDGTPAGTHVVRDLVQGSASSQPFGLTNVNGTLFFGASDESGDIELYRSNGTDVSTVLVKNINPTGSSRIAQLTESGGSLYFVADDGLNGRELWKSDGTTIGTTLISEVTVGTSESGIRDITRSGGRTYFTALVGADRELWRTDGTQAGTIRLTTLPNDTANLPTKFDSPSNLVDVNGQLFFVVKANVETLDTTYSYADLWKSDGTALGTTKVKTIVGNYTDNQQFETVSFRGRCYVMASSDGLFRSDGTSDGTTFVASGSGYSAEMEVVGTNLYFAGPNGSELRYTDGFSTLTLGDIQYGSGHSQPRYFTADGTGLYALINTSSNSTPSLIRIEGGSYSYPSTAFDSTGQFIAGTDPELTKTLSDVFYTRGGALWWIASNARPYANTVNGTSVPIGGVITIPWQSLNGVDPEGTSVSFVVTGGLVNGKLENVLNPGVAITQFSFSDLTSGQIVYKHNGAILAGDTFSFQVQDATGLRSLATYTYRIDMLSFWDTFISIEPNAGVNEVRVNDKYPGGKHDRISIYYENNSTQYVTIRNDDGRPIYVGGGLLGTFGSGTSTVRIPSATINSIGAIRFTLGTGDDTLNVYSDFDRPFANLGLKVDFGPGADRLNSPRRTDRSQTWNVNQAAGGTLAMGSPGNVIFSGMESLGGGNGNDLFKVTNAEAANLTLIGSTNGFSSGIDTLDVYADGAIFLGNTLMRINSTGIDRNFNLNGIDNAILSGGAAPNVFDARGFSGDTTMYTYTGNDRLFGGTGNDTMFGGAGTDILLGGAGNDILDGGDNRDFLIGGAGSDTLRGGVSDDILIAGTTWHDGNRAALEAIMASWAGNLSYADRVKAIRTTGVGAGYRLTAQSVVDDSATDTLQGGTNTDLFFAELTAGRVIDSRDPVTGEIVYDVA